MLHGHRMTAVVSNAMLPNSSGKAKLRVSIYRGKAQV